MSSISELRKEIHNLASQRYRITQIQTDPNFREKERIRHHKYYLTHTAQTKKRTREYIKSHREWFNAYKRAWYARNKKK